MAAVSPVCGSQASSAGVSSPPAPAPAPAAGLGRCRMALLLAVALDVAGMAALLTGVFAQLQTGPRAPHVRLRIPPRASAARHARGGAWSGGHGQRVSPRQLHPSGPD
ncbi:transmembrane protein 238 [Sigmodon hispidus]